MGEDRTCRVEMVGHVCHIGIKGRFDFNRNGDFHRAVEAARRLPGVRQYLVDLREAPYLDSSALGMLLNFNDEAAAEGRAVVLANAGGMARQILEIANFQTIFEMR